MIHIREFQQLRIDLSEFSTIPTSNPLELTKKRYGPGYRFQFELVRKQTNIGSLEIDQWWMDKRGLYGERKRDSSNRSAAIDLFWSLCMCDGSAFSERDIQETYILARLLPHARSNASRRVFVDASLGYRTPADDLSELDQLLSRSRDGRKDALDFNRSTGIILGPPRYDQNVFDRCKEFVAELMDETCKALSNGNLEKYQEAETLWTDRMKSIGRRSGHQLEKNVLDILSYEARAAFHRCYSQAWLYILEKLTREECLSQESRLFHRLWNLDQIIPGNENCNADFHLFHGHIFGLHPAGSDLIRTETGRELLGDLIANHTEVEYHQRFLNGMNIACFAYADRHNVSKELRKKDTESLTELQQNFINSSGRMEPQNKPRKPLD